MAGTNDTKIIDSFNSSNQQPLEKLSAPEPNETPNLYFITDDEASVKAEAYRKPFLVDALETLIDEKPSPRLRTY